MCSVKTMFLKISQNSLENTCGRVSLLIKLQVSCRLQVSGLWHRCFPVNFAKFLITPFFTEHIQWLRLYIRRFPYCYKNILLNWKQHLSTDPETISVILSQNIRFNKHIIIDNYVVYFTKFSQKKYRIYRLISKRILLLTEKKKF